LLSYITNSLNILIIDSGKWPSSFENWPWFLLPLYLQGAGIVISGSAVHPLLGAMQTTPYYIWDDIYLIGLCAVKARLHIRISDRLDGIFLLLQLQIEVKTID
jgi:hypothetical protein